MRHLKICASNFINIYSYIVHNQLYAQIHTHTHTNTQGNIMTIVFFKNARMDKVPLKPHGSADYTQQ